MTGRSALLSRALTERRRSTTALSIGLAALTAWIVAVYPLLRDSDAFSEFLDRFPPALASLFGLDPDTYLTGAGYLGSQIFSLFAPLMIIAFAVEGALQTTARDEQSGAMDMLLSMPADRRRLFLERFTATAVLSAIVCGVFAIVLIASNPIVDLRLSIIGIVGACTALWLLGLVFGTLAAALAAFTGQVGSARGVALGLAFVAWMITGFAPLYEWLEIPARISPLTWYEHNAPLLNGFSSGHVWLATTVVLLGVIAVQLFGRRDIGTERAVVRLIPKRRVRQRPLRSSWLLTSVARKTVWDRRRSIWAWTGALAVLLFVTFSAWPAFSEDSEALEQLISTLPPEVFALFGMTDPGSLAQAPGFISSRAFQSVGPILIVALGITSVASLVGREESDGVLDMVLSHPIGRRSVLAGKTLGITSLFALLFLALTVVTFAGDISVSTELDAVNMIAANLGLALLGLAFAGITLAAWSLGFTTRIVSGFAGFAWFLNGLGSIVDVLEPLRPLSPFYWYLGDTAPLGKGFEPAYALLAVLAVAAAWVAMRRIDSRDLAV